MRARLPNGAIDWDKLEKAWNAGRYGSFAALAAVAGVGRATLYRRIEADRAQNPARWQADRTKDVQRATQALLMQQQLGKTIAAGQEAEAILAAAVATRDLILQHRGDAGETRKLAMDMAAELRAATTDKVRLAALLQAATESLDEEQAAALRAGLQRLVSLHSRVGSLHKLADALAKLQTLERRAFGLTDDAADTDPLASYTEDELIREADRLRQRIADVRGSAG